MDSETWMAFANEAEPLLKGFMKIAKDYNMGLNPLSVAVFADSNSWVTFIDEDEKGNNTVHYEMKIDVAGTLHISDNSRKRMSARSKA